MSYKPRIVLFRGEWCYKSTDGNWFTCMGSWEWRGRLPGIGSFYEGALA